jgi:dTDP-4-dehydrorhamnose reductase
VAPTIKAVKMADVPLKAERPLFCALSNDKLRAAGITMPTWQTALARYVARIAGEG